MIERLRDRHASLLRNRGTAGSAIRGASTKMRGGRARKKCVITRDYSLIADSPRSVLRETRGSRAREKAMRRAGPRNYLAEKYSRAS